MATYIKVEGRLDDDFEDLDESDDFENDDDENEEEEEEYVKEEGDSDFECEMGRCSSECCSDSDSDFDDGDESVYSCDESDWSEDYQSVIDSSNYLDPVFIEKIEELFYEDMEVESPFDDPLSRADLYRRLNAEGSFTFFPSP